MNIIAGLAIIGVGVFAVAVFIKALKENEVVEAARAEDAHKAIQLESKRSEWFSIPQSPLFPTPQNMTLWSQRWTPELDAFIHNHGISLENSNGGVYHRCLGIPTPPLVQKVIDPSKPIQDPRGAIVMTDGTIVMTDPNFGEFEHPSVDGDRLSEYMPNSFECMGTAEDAEKIGLKLD